MNETINRALYRGQDIETGEWRFGCLDANTGFKNKVYIVVPGSGYQVNPETVGQWTGLTDKNGVKIFEGDLLSHRFYNGPVVVSFSNGSFIAEDVCMLGSPVEVIGSIHSNPELLKGGE